MTANGPTSLPNPDLEVGRDNRSAWSRTDTRRWGFHNLHVISRYSLGIRAPAVLELHKCFDMRVPDLPLVRKLTGSPFFSGMAVVRGSDVIYENYAPDFGPERVHSIQSITKTTLHFIMAGLVKNGLLDMTKRVDHYLPEIGSGYAAATVQQVADMDVANDYSEDYADLCASVFEQEVAMGWRLPRPGRGEDTLRSFVLTVESPDTTNRSGAADYKSANTDVLAWIAERVSGRSVRAMLIDIVEAAGIEGTFHISTDRDGVPVVSGGGSVTARDLARYGLLLARHGAGVDGKAIGSADFTRQSIAHPGPPMPEPRNWMSYSNQLMTNGRWLGHGGFGGQFLLADPPTDMAMAFFSVMENREAIDTAYYTDVVQMGIDIADLLGGS
jgi:CubicO group peptidase (beta-lactamase class C family)